LKRRPVVSGWFGHSKTNLREALWRAQVGYLQHDLPPVMIVGNAAAGQKSALGKPSIPLRDGGGRLVSEIHASNDRTALPSTARCRHSSSEWRRPVRGMPNPLADDGDSLDWKGHRD